MKNLLIFGAAMLVSAFSSAADVTVTKDPATVVACTYLDVFHSHPPYILPGADIRQLKSRAAEIGADTLLVVSRSVVSEGKAYKCKAPTAGASAPKSSAP